MKTEKFIHYFQCDRCNIDSFTKDKICPCARASCKAVKKGRIKITKELILNNKPVETTNEQPKCRLVGGTCKCKRPYDIQYLG